MIYINNINKRLTQKGISFVITDFDRTITYHDSSTTWSLFSSSKLINPKFKLESDSLYKFYRNIELSSSIPHEKKSIHMYNWALRQMSLFKKYNINEHIFYKIIDQANDFCLRSDFISFSKRLEQLGIRIYIVSGGISNVIKYILIKNGISLNNITIISNEIIFCENNIGIGDNIIHSFNKGDISLPIRREECGLLFGDMISDKDIGKNYNTIDIVFTDEEHSKQNNKYFDISLTGDSSFSNVGKILIKNYKGE